MRALFLDFDGVAHPVSAIEDWRTLNVHGADLQHLIEKRNLFRWMPKLEAALEDHPDVLLFVHSGWRSVADNSKMKTILGPLADRFVGVTSLELNRFDGIQEMVRRADVATYLVIDDATHEFPANFEFLLSTNPETGLNDNLVNDALRKWLEQTAPCMTLAPAMTG